MTNIVRRKDFAGGGITAAEKARMKEHSDLWIQRIMRTEPIEAHEIVPALKGLYAAAGLKEPRIVIVPSPLVMAVASGFAAALWYGRTHDEYGNATYNATREATDMATYNATSYATSAVIRFNSGE